MWLRGSCTRELSISPDSLRGHRHRSADVACAPLPLDAGAWLESVEELWARHVRDAIPHQYRDRISQGVRQLAAAARGPQDALASRQVQETATNAGTTRRAGSLGRRFASPHEVPLYVLESS